MLVYSGGTWDVAAVVVCIGSDVVVTGFTVIAVGNDVVGLLDGIDVGFDVRGLSVGLIPGLLGGLVLG